MCTTFRDEFNALMAEAVPAENMHFNWKDTERDPNGLYLIDCRVDWKGIPIFVHALANDAETQDATITLHQFEQWGIQFMSVAVFEDQTFIDRRILAQFGDVAGTQFASLSGYNKSRIMKFIRKCIGLRE